MGLVLQVIWQLMNLCIIVAAIGFPRSSAFGEPLSLESSSPFPSTEAQVPTSIIEQGPLLNGSLVQPPLISPSITAPPNHGLIEGPPPFLSPKQSTTFPPQPLHAAPQLPTEPPKPSLVTNAKSPQHSISPITELPHDLPPPLPPSEPPHHSTPPSAEPSYKSSLTPPAEPPHAADVPPPLPPSKPQYHLAPPTAEPSYKSSTIPPAEPPHTSDAPPAAKSPVAMPQLPNAEPPEALPLASPPHFSIPANVSSHASPQQPVAKSPLSSALPLAAKPPESDPHLPDVIPSTMPPPPVELQSPPLSRNAPSSMPQPYSYALSPPLQLVAPNAPPPMYIVDPHASDVPPPLPPSEPRQHSAPTSIAEPSYNSSTTPPAEPPHASDAPPAAKPPVAMPQLPNAEPPEALPLASPPHFSISANVSSHASPQPLVAKSPLSSALPLAAKPPESDPHLPVVVPPAMPPPPSDLQSPPSQNAPSSMPQPSPYAMSPPPQLVSPNAPPPMSIVNPHAPPPTTLPSSPPLPWKVISPPPSLVPPTVYSPPPLVSPIEGAPSPQMAPPIPPIVSPSPPKLIPPIESASPPQLTPMFAPPPVLTPPVVSSPPQPIPPIESNPQPTPPVVSPPTQLTRPVAPPPTQLTPPVVSPPPQMTPPNVSPPPQHTPPIVSPPSNLTPPIVSPPPQRTPPIVSPPPQLTPPIMPPPQSTTPPDLLTPAVPSNASVPPPLSLPPPHVPLSPPGSPPHASPPTPSHAESPLPKPSQPHAPSPPFYLSAPPPVELPHISPPYSRAIPPLFSPPSPFLNPPLTPVSHVIPSNPLYAPPPSEPSHPYGPPSPAMQRTVPAAPPHSSQRKETQEGAPPISQSSPDSSPSSETLPEVTPPAPHITPRSLPPNSHDMEAPKHAPPLRTNATEPATLPSSAPSPSRSPSRGRYSSIAPPGRAPDSSPGDTPSPYPEPTVERHDPTAPTPLSFSISPTSNGSRLSLHHSPVKVPPPPMAPLPSPPEIPEISPASSSLPRGPHGHSMIPVPSPQISPYGSSTRNTKRPVAPFIRALPPPPPNADCAYMTCDEPLTNTPPGSPCGCVWPMQVGMRLGVELFTFFPLVSELAREVAAGVFMKPSQVRVMGANYTTEDPEETIVIINLVPLNEKFDYTTALLIFQRFWHKQVVIDKSLFGNYDVLYVRYPGLPPSPPMAPADIAVINGMPYSVKDPNKMHPLGVDVTKQRHKHRLNGVVIAAVVISATVALLICCFVAWLIVFRHTNHEPQPAEVPRALPSLGRSSGPTGNSTGSGPSSSLSIGSSLPPYTGSAKTFSASEIEKATDNFSPSRVLGEGGFGLVYRGVLEDTTQVAVKVLKRDDQQGGREFLAEVEMLGRLHHRNLVKLIGICTDERLRCLVYELVPNGSVDSHLHGKDKESSPLDWASRMKIALGAARGLAYLHEDSSPRVIHRDFKSSNILLENDFTPKVSDFGLARAAMDEENRHISTRVMGTFGYVAPEYAMTGHLLVKSDVYSYGVVLLEILTGRKPVDMSQPPGQENLVAWTRPFLTTQEGLELILDPSLGPNVPLDSVAKVAAIASMCVQPEVSHRPFMGEVVQALKLVCNESGGSNDSSSRHGSHGNLSADFDTKGSPLSETRNHLPSQFEVKNYLHGVDVEKGMSVSEIFSASVNTDKQVSESFRRHSKSGPLKTENGRHFWQRVRRLSNEGSVSEHGVMYRLWSG